MIISSFTIQAFSLFSPSFLLNVGAIQLNFIDDARQSPNFKLNVCWLTMGYDTDSIIRCALQSGMTPVIPLKKNRKVLRNYGKHIYKLRHLVENAFLHLKRWRGIAARYASNVASFVAAV